VQQSIAMFLIFYEIEGLSASPRSEMSEPPLDRWDDGIRLL